MASDIGLDDLRRYAVARTFFAPTSLARAIDRLGFVQADPIRAPARAQDLTLRHRVKDYRAGDLERDYPKLPVEEDFFVNYGFMPRRLHALMHPRAEREPFDAATQARADALLAFVAAEGRAHPRAADAYFAHGTVANYWGGKSNATTHLLDAMHYRGLLRVAHREGGIRVYAVQHHAPVPDDAAAFAQRLDALVDVVVCKYAPLPAATLGDLVRRLRLAVPQSAPHLRAALDRAKQRLARTTIDSIEWYWPADERPLSWRDAIDDRVRLLAPFDPIVWDRKRFELFWGWRYRFEAYHPAPKRKFGYYAMPMLWRDKIVGWGNMSFADGVLTGDFGYATQAPKGRAFARALKAELERLQAFLL
jgi:uncharacterized protein